MQAMDSGPCAEDGICRKLVQLARGFGYLVEGLIRDQRLSSSK